MFKKDKRVTSTVEIVLRAAQCKRTQVNKLDKINSTVGGFTFLFSGFKFIYLNLSYFSS